jgi:hypothetical protein
MCTENLIRVNWGERIAPRWRQRSRLSSFPELLAAFFKSKIGLEAE